MRWVLVTAGLYGVIAIGLGAFAAHGFEDFAGGLGYDPTEAARRLDNLLTGARYQLVTAAALLAIGVSAPASRGWAFAAGLLVFGAAVFSGCLYALSIAGGGWRWLGAIVPIGGASMIAGWATIAVTAIRQSVPPDADLPIGSPNPASEQELVRLEEAITHQQQLVQDLNEALTDSRTEVDELTRRLHRLEPTIERLLEFQRGSEDLPDERPPHY